MSVVAVESATRRFGDFVAVDGADLRVEPGEVVGLIGANGAGKTTLIRMLLGLLEPTSGSVQLFGDRPSRDQRRRIGYVPQNLGLYRDLTVDENLVFRARAFGLDESADASVFADGVVGRLSLGVQRRAAFAAATQHAPDLLVLDEPTSGVSPLARSSLWDGIRLQASGGAAVLVSTHYMDEAAQADRVVVMSRGRVIAEGSADDIVDGSVALEVAASDWRKAFDVLAGAERLLTLDGTSIRVVGEGAEALRAELRSAGVEAEVRAVPATLEETLVLSES